MAATSPGVLPDDRRFIIGMVADVTESRRAELELEKSKRAVEAASAMKDQFLANISHELRTPLSVILMWSHLLSKPSLSKKEEREAIEAIARGAEAQRRLIDDLLDMTRIVSGKMQIRVRTVEMPAVIVAAVDMIRPLAQDKQIDLKVTIDERVGSINIDPGRVEQVLWVLLTNAVKFTPSGGLIRLEAVGEPDGVSVMISDTGCGIPAELMPQLFRPFVQGEVTPRQGKTGLGLGLSIARSIVDLHGGTIRASSAGAGRGATFTVRIPSGNVSAASEVVAAHAAGHPLLVDKTVLVVDDDLDTMRAVEVTLEQAGATVKAVSSPVEALRIFSDLRPDLIITDVSMPEISGLEMMRQIRSWERAQGLNETPAIVLSAMAAKADRDAAEASGLHVFLPKPIEPDTLIQQALQALSM